jgi:hypothetical protein
MEWSLLQIQINSKKPGFGRKKSVENETCKFTINCRTKIIDIKIKIQQSKISIAQTNSPKWFHATKKFKNHELEKKIWNL